MAAAAAVAIADMNAYLQQVIGVANNGQRQRLINNGIDSIRSLANKDDKFASGVCTIVRKGDGQPNVRSVTMLTEDRLKALVDYSKYCYLTNRDLDDYNVATLELITTVHDWFKQLEKDVTDTVDKFHSEKSRRRWIESVDDYLSLKLGNASKIPLSYVIRTSDTVDPGDIPALTVDTDFVLDLELHGRHDGTYWQADRRSVWIFLKQKCFDTVAWTTIERFERAHRGANANPVNDGRGAYLALVAQFMGPDVRNALMDRATKTLKTIHFDGRNRNFTFDKFIARMRGAFTDLGEDDQMSDMRKVRTLMQAWTVPGLTHLKAIVSSDPRYTNNFENCVTFLSGQLADYKANDSERRSAGSTTTNDRNVSSTTTSGNNKKNKRNNNSGGSRKKNKNSGNDLLKYLPPKEWAKLSKEEQDARRQARAKQKEQKAGHHRQASSVTTTPPATQPAATTTPPSQPTVLQVASVAATQRKPKSVTINPTPQVTVFQPPQHDAPAGYRWNLVQD